MDLETQIAFIKSEKQKHSDAIAILQAVEDTLIAKIEPVVASMAPLQGRVAELEPENADLKQQIVDKNKIITDLTAANEALTAKVDSPIAVKAIE